MLVFWSANNAEMRWAPNSTSGTTPTSKKPTLMYQRRLCTEASFGFRSRPPGWSGKAEADADSPALAHADPERVELIIKPTGFFHVKAKTIIATSAALVERFGGQVPPRMEDLVTLPGVGRKTANVVLGVAFDIPGFAVDTHVIRLTGRLGLTKQSDPVKIEADVTKLIPPEEWTGFSLRLILHGRRICAARAPRCPECVLNDFCPSSSVGRPRRRPLTAAKGSIRLGHGRRSAGKPRSEERRVGQE